jgi:DNA polymerase III subunit gamma/tau
MQSSISLRPRSIDQMVGQSKIINRLRGSFKKNKLPHAMMFTGKKGSGKTSFARIIALSLQCTHQDKFGIPCKICRSQRKNFPIYELDGGKVRGVEQVEDFISQAQFDIIGKGKKKVFIFDEAHRLSGHAQDALLKSFEDDKHCQWIICSTRADKIIDTLRSRCRQYPLKPLDREDTILLVKRVLKKHDSELSVDDLVDNLVDNKVDSARLIVNACDEYISGSSAEDAAQVEGTTSVDSKALIRATGKGKWDDVSKILQKTSEGDLRLLRASFINYLRPILLESTEANERTKTIADAIKKLGYVTSAEDSVQLSVFAAELFGLCTMFAEYNI